MEQNSETATSIRSPEFLAPICRGFGTLLFVCSFIVGAWVITVVSGSPGFSASVLMIAYAIGLLVSGLIWGVLLYAAARLLDSSDMILDKLEQSGGAEHHKGEEA